MNILKYPRSFFKGIKNLIEWFPIIWNDRDWDYYFIYKILLKKLENMEIYFNSDSPNISDAKDVAENITECKNILKRLMEEDYYENNNPLYKEAIKKYGCPSINMEGEKKELFSRAFKEVSRMIEDDHDTLYRMLHKNIRNWWD